MGRPLHELLHISHALQRILNHAFVCLRELGFAAQLLNVVPVRRSARNPPRRSMRLLKKSGISQVRHHGFTLVHRRDDTQVTDTLVGHSLGHQTLGYDSDYLPAGR